MTTTQQKAMQIKLAVFDIDGVMTDGRLYFTDDGTEMKAFNVKDGLGIKWLQKSGIETAIITGRTSRLVIKRASDLGIPHLIQGREDKIIALKELLESLNIPREGVAYMGDDMPDLGAIAFAGFGATVADANPLIKEQADWVSAEKGGQGAVREFCEYILQAQNRLEPILAEYALKAEQIP